VVERAVRLIEGNRERFANPLAQQAARAGHLVTGVGRQQQVASRQWPGPDGRGGSTW
jgi:hypothetical protein